MHTKPRRQFLGSAALSFGTLALNALLPKWSSAAAEENPLAAREGHHPPTAKRVIFIFNNGGPSHHETFDYRPELARAADRDPKYLAPQLKFDQYGESGLWISEAFPELGKHADDLCILNGMRTNSNDHFQGVVKLHTGNHMFVRPSFGSWIVHGLGSEADDLPGFITIDPMQKLNGAGNFGSAFLPATFQGTPIRGVGPDSVPNLSNDLLTDRDQRSQLEFVNRANQQLSNRFSNNSELKGVLSSYELAFRMQTSIPETFDISQESAATRALYGLDDKTTAHFGERCLMARRLAERGVRFIQLSTDGWDTHSNAARTVLAKGAMFDKPMAGLLADLKSRDLLKDTLVIWGGEFGRGAKEDLAVGRDHNGSGFTFWLAGGGVKGGHVHGDKDDVGQESVDGLVDFHDLHATVLHVLGLNHKRLTYKYAGRDFRLTDTEGKVVREILA